MTKTQLIITIAAMSIAMVINWYLWKWFINFMVTQ